MDQAKKIMKTVKYPLLLLFLITGCVAKDTYLAKEQEARRFKSDLEEIRSRYAELKEQYRELEEEKERIDKKGEEISTQLDEARAESSEKDLEIKRLKEKIRLLENSLSDKKDAMSKSIAELMSKLDSMEAEKIALKKELAGYKDLIKLRDAEIQELKRKFDQKAEELLSNLGKTKEQAEKIEQKLEKTKAKLADLEKESATYKEMNQQMAKEIKDGNIAISELRGKLRVTLLSQVLFDSGKTTIKKDGLEVLKRVSAVLSKVHDKDIRIEGHTDSDKIHGSLSQKYPTNWELSVARAVNVARFLVEKAGLDPRNMYAAGYGEFRPVVPNDTPENKAKNRRIEIMLTPH
jgi:chemotaxis protein MotB